MAPSARQDCSMYWCRGGRGFPHWPMPKVFDALKLEGSARPWRVQQLLGDGVVRPTACPGLFRTGQKVVA